jgi:methionyl aminopeptidase
MIPLKTQEEIGIMAEGGRILSGIMKKLSKLVKPGITTKDLDRVAETLIFKAGAEPSFKGQQGYPASFCFSLNEKIVHGVPSESVLLKEGDIITLDIGMKYKGFHTDMAVTLPVGRVEPEIKRMIWVTRKALKRAIKKVRPGNTFGDIGNTIQRYVESQGFNIIRELCGHGIGKDLHEDPQILNYGKRHIGPEIQEGMVFCIEPMVTKGDWRIKQSKDRIGYETFDGSWAAHFEQTVAVTKHGAKILTEI